MLAGRNEIHHQWLYFIPYHNSGSLSKWFKENLKSRQQETNLTACMSCPAAAAADACDQVEPDCKRNV